MHVDNEVRFNYSNMIILSKNYCNLRIRNLNCDTTYQTAESLHFKLSLKKQIWTGTQDANLLEFSRPLSWGAHVSSNALINKSMFYDSEALLT